MCLEHPDFAGLTTRYPRLPMAKRLAIQASGIVVPARSHFAKATLPGAPLRFFGASLRCAQPPG